MNGWMEEGKERKKGKEKKGREGKERKGILPKK